MAAAYMMITTCSRNERGGDLYRTWQVMATKTKDKRLEKTGCRLRQLVVEVRYVSAVDRLDKSKVPGSLCSTLMVYARL